MKNHVTIDEEVIGILEAGELRDGKYYLRGQLERKMYEAVNKALVLMGGKWNKSAKAHVFDRNPSDILENTIRTGHILDEKKAFQFFETPGHVVDRLLELAMIGEDHRALEPSAGRGAISQKMRRYTRNLVAVELNQRMADELLSHQPAYTVVYGDFLACKDDNGFDRVVMNPPFSFQQDIKHIRHAMTLLAPGGLLVAICGNGSRQNEILKPLAKTWEVLPRDTFSDTSASTAILTFAV